MIGKDKHLRESEIAVLQEQVERCFRALEAFSVKVPRSLTANVAVRPHEAGPDP